MEVIMMKRHEAKNKMQSGFTLVELLVTVAISGFLLAATYASYSSQQKSHVIQDQLGKIQQNLRAAMLTMTRDIREAGCDPKQKGMAGFEMATAGQIRITRDIAGHAVNPNQGDGYVNAANEDLIFGFGPAVDTDADPDGIPDTAAVADFGRNDVNADGLNVFQPIAENIERVEFTYLDEDGNIIAAPIKSFSNLNKIRAVQVSMLVRAPRQDPEFVNTATYTTAAGTQWGPFNDNFRRRLAATTIQCRNKGF